MLKNVLAQPTEYVWHKDERDLSQFDGIVIPGGFSYGDYLRCGAIARFSPVMKGVKAAAARGAIILGICNGFQILCEAGLLPGALIRNAGLSFRCHTQTVRVEHPVSRFTSEYNTGQVLRMPIAHGEGNYVADPLTLAKLAQNRQILFTYCDNRGRSTPESNPNGASLNIAGICNEAGNVLGLMPHPERASEAILRSTDGKGLFESILSSFNSAKKPESSAEAAPSPVETAPVSPASPEPQPEPAVS